MGLSALRTDKSDMECDLKNPSKSLECKNKEYYIPHLCFGKINLTEKDLLKKRAYNKGAVKGARCLSEYNMYA